MIRGFGIRLQILLLVAGPLLFLILVLVFASIIQQRTDAATALSAHGADVLAQSDAIFHTTNEGGLALSAYVRDRKPKLLTPYRAAVAQLPREIKELENLVVGDPVGEREAQQLGKVTTAIIRLWNEYLGYVQTGQKTKMTALENAPSTRALSVAWLSAKLSFDADQRARIIVRLNTLRASLHTLEDTLLVIAGIGTLFTLLIAIQFGLSIVRRLRRLAENAEMLSRGQNAESIGGNDEIAILDHTYRDITHRMLKSVEEREHAVALYEREHNVAMTLQRALLPASLPVIAGLRIDGSYLPATEGAEVGGDWYDVFELPGRRVGLSIGDVAGHGLRAAILMGNMRQMIRGAARFETSPAGVLNHVNQFLCAEDNALVTAFFGILDLNDGVLRYSMAGHPSPIIVEPNGNISPLPGEGIVLGFDRNTPFSDFQARLDVGWGIILFTDGVVEIERNYFKGLRDLEDATIAEYFDPSPNIAEGIQERVMGDLKTRDDAAVLFVGITALASPSAIDRQWTFDAHDQAAALRMKRAVLLQFAGLESSSPELGAIESVLGELLSNVARHSPGEATVTLESRDGEVILHVTDSGDPFELVESPPDPLAESGRGLMIVRAFSREIALSRFNGGNRVSAVLPLPKSFSATS